MFLNDLPSNLRHYIEHDERLSLFFPESHHRRLRNRVAKHPMHPRCSRLQRVGRMGCNTLKMYLNHKTFNLKLALELFPVNDEGGDGGPVESELMELSGSRFSSCKH